MDVSQIEVVVSSNVVVRLHGQSWVVTNQDGVHLLEVQDRGVTIASFVSWVAVYSSAHQVK